MTTYYLPARKIKLRRRPGGAMALKLDGQTVPLGPPRRALPLSEPDRFIVLSDGEGNELGVVRHMDELELESRDVLREALDRLYVINRITRILEVEKEPLTGQTRWRVEIATEDKNEEDGNSSNDAGSKNGHAVESGHDASDAMEAPQQGTLLTKVNWLRRRNKSGVFVARHRDAPKKEGLHPNLQPKKMVRVEETVATEEREFLINGQEDVQTARYPHIYIVDAEGHRYEVRDCEALDLESRRAAERFF